MISLLVFTDRAWSTGFPAGLPGRYLAASGEVTGHRWGRKWPPTGIFHWPPSKQVTVRYFAAAAAAAGVKEDAVELSDRATIAEILERVQGRHGDRLRQVLRCSTFLLNEVAVRNSRTVVEPGSTLDVLPPFAGG
ncbi:MoaD/ThiS family protein [Frankia sp. R43]|uniref:MoaD/ThiS family protein n=1 Tax=Frankia sp. R43 TaxID=269536 RepID=UPI0009F8C756|nr:MoaD/ThiS family protein [Frankia sp. R43]